MHIGIIIIKYACRVIQAFLLWESHTNYWTRIHGWSVSLIFSFPDI